jgi:hypothetical protein
MVDDVGLKAFLLHVFRFACVSECCPSGVPRAGGGEADVDVTKSRKRSVAFDCDSPLLAGREMRAGRGGGCACEKREGAAPPLALEESHKNNV